MCVIKTYSLIYRMYDYITHVKRMLGEYAKDKEKLIYERFA